MNPFVYHSVRLSTYLVVMGVISKIFGNRMRALEERGLNLLQMRSPELFDQASVPRSAAWYEPGTSLLSLWLLRRDDRLREDRALDRLSISYRRTYATLVILWVVSLVLFGVYEATRTL